MLPPEIEPFADHHIAELEAVQQFLIMIQSANRTAVVIPSDEAFEANLGRIKNAQNAFVRFKVCMADEVRQKERLHEKNLNCRLHHQ